MFFHFLQLRYRGISAVAGETLLAGVVAGVRVPWGAWLRGQRCVPQLAGQVRVSVTFSITLGPKPQRGVARGPGAWGAGRGWALALASKFRARSTFWGGPRPWLPARCSTRGRHAEPPAGYLRHLSLALYVSRPRRPQGKRVPGPREGGCVCQPGLAGRGEPRRLRGAAAGREGPAGPASPWRRRGAAAMAEKEGNGEGKAGAGAGASRPAECAGGLAAGTGRRRAPAERGRPAAASGLPPPAGEAAAGGVCPSRGWRQGGTGTRTGRHRRTYVCACMRACMHLYMNACPRTRI